MALDIFRRFTFYRIIQRMVVVWTIWAKACRIIGLVLLFCSRTFGEAVQLMIKRGRRGGGGGEKEQTRKMRKGKKEENQRAVWTKSSGRKTIASAATNGFEQNALLHDKANLEEALYISICSSNFGCNCLEFPRFVSVNVHHQITNKTFFIGCMTKQISGRGNLTGSSLDLAASQLVYRIHPTTTAAR